MKLLMETDIETGLRWGELTELRRQGPRLRHRILTVSRAVVAGRPEVPPRRVSGSWSRNTPRTRSTAASSSAPSWPRKIGAHITTHGLGPDDLIFPMPRRTPPPPGCGCPRPGDARADQAQRRRAPVPARDAERVQRRQVPVQLLQGRRRHLPGAAPGGGQGLSARPTDGRHRRAHPPRTGSALKVWQPALKTAGICLHGTLRPASRTCLVAARRGADLQSSRNASATAASPPRKSTCTPSLRPTTPRWMPSARSATAGTARARDA